VAVVSADELRVAVIGAGPSGFYVTEQLLKNAAVPVSVDVFDRLPTPWGLVRSGVAPDHPAIKSVSRVFEKTAADARFRFYGNGRTSPMRASACGRYPRRTRSAPRTGPRIALLDGRPDGSGNR
jgi:NADPH-dependent glutamate synthase beta subunit-like oxidoreductase